jgi:hypothetical protein
MELFIVIGGLLLLDMLAMRFGVDSRALNARDGRPWWPDLTHDYSQDYAGWHLAQLRHEAHLDGLASLAVTRMPLRIRMAYGLRKLAVAIEPAYQASQWTIDSSGTRSAARNVSPV